MTLESDSTGTATPPVATTRSAGTAPATTGSPSPRPASAFTPHARFAGARMEPGVVGVLMDDGDVAVHHARSLDHFGGYALEILSHAGIRAVLLDRADLRSGALPRFVLLPYRVRLSSQEVAVLRTHVEDGGALVATGGVEGGNELFGLDATRRYAASATLSWPAGALGLEAQSLPAWEVQLASATADGEAIGSVLLGAAGPPDQDLPGQPPEAPQGPWAAAVTRPLGRGVSVWLAPDIPASVVRLQQGRPVRGDGHPAPEGSARLDDRLLKTDDGTVLDWSWRETGPEGDAFLEPYADRLRELLLAALVDCAERLGAPLPIVWFWPGAEEAAAAASFDTDSNEGPDGERFLQVLRELELRGTWCVMYPGGYPRSLYDELRADGQEIALHYDGLTTDLNGSPHCDWSQEALEHQYRWLRQEVGIPGVVSQKNHVTRWEGWVEFFRWLEQAGILVDQSKGPSKIGNLGYPFGTCHLWRPIEDLRHDNRLMDVLELTFQTHDMGTSGARVALRRSLLDRAVARHGIVHFIFHPQRIWEDGMPEAITDIVGYARQRGLRWWTSEELADWEVARRATEVRIVAGGSGHAIELHHAPPQLTLLLPGHQGNLEHSRGVTVTEVEFLNRTFGCLVFSDEAPPDPRLELPGA